MKSKLILTLAAISLIIALIFLAMPAVSPDVDVGVAGGSVAADTADLDVMISGAVYVPGSNTVPAVAAVDKTLMWLALGASLVTIAVASRRRLTNLLDLTIISLRRLSGSTNEGARMGGGPLKFILPAAA